MRQPVCLCGGLSLQGPHSRCAQRDGRAGGLLTCQQARVVSATLHALVQLQGGLIASIHPHSVAARPAENQDTQLDCEMQEGGAAQPRQRTGGLRGCLQPISAQGASKAYLNISELSLVLRPLTRGSVLRFRRQVPASCQLHLQRCQAGAGDLEAGPRIVRTPRKIASWAEEVKHVGTLDRVQCSTAT